MEETEVEVPVEVDEAEDKKKKKESLAYITKCILNQFVENGTLFKSQYKEAWVAPEKENGADILPIDSDEFRSRICSIALNDYDKVLSKNAVEAIINTLKGYALYGKNSKEYRLEVRSYKVDNKPVYWWDMGGTAVTFSPKGWRIVEAVEKPPIMFARYPHQLPQPRPVNGGDIHLLRKYIKTEDENDYLQVLVFICAAFLPGFSKVILTFTGEPGASKTTTMKMIKSLVDNSKMLCSPIPKSSDEMVRDAAHHSVLVYDNLSKLSWDKSDLMCMLVSGTGISRRKLFTTDTDQVYNLQKCLLVNGINSVATQSDLLDRSTIINLARIKPEERRTDEELWSEWEKDKPLILGAVFNTLVTALRILPTIKVKKSPRQADYFRYGIAIAEALDGFKGDDFIRAYDTVTERQNEEALNASPLAQAIIWLMKPGGSCAASGGWYDKNGDYVATCTELLMDIGEATAGYDYLGERSDRWELLHWRRSPGWPTDPSQVGRQLRRIKPNLASIGIIVSTYTEKNKRMVRIHKVNDDYYNGDRVKNIFSNEYFEKTRGAWPDYTRDWDKHSAEEVIDKHRYHAKKYRQSLKDLSRREEAEKKDYQVTRAKEIAENNKGE